MKRTNIMNLRPLLSLGLLATALGAATLPAAAQDTYRGYGQNDAMSGPTYRNWQPSWDQGNVDRRHVILGTVSDFKPFRLQVARRNGTVQTVDLKQGTRIFPRGETPAINERVALVGYYSNGTFIANRVILHD
jgi:hypothetical protein